MSSPFEKKFMLSLEENESERLGPSEDQARKFWAGSNRCTLQEVEFACTWFKLNLMSALENSGQESEKKKRRRRRINKINKLKKRQESLRVSGFWFQLCDFFSLVATAIDNWRFALHHLQTTHHSRTWKFEFFFYILNELYPHYFIQDMTVEIASCYWKHYIQFATACSKKKVSHKKDLHNYKY